MLLMPLTPSATLQVIHSQEADAAEFQSTIRNYEATKSAQDQLVQRVRSDNERLERQRSELSDKLGQCEVELEQARYREGLLEKELKEQKEACHELQLKQVLALTGSGSSPGRQSANQLVVATSAQASDVNAVTAELEAFKQRYKAAAKSRAECAEVCFCVGFGWWRTSVQHCSLLTGSVSVKS